MKKIGKNILLMIIGGIIFSVVSVYAAISISANNITLSSTKTSKTNVKDALDELYDKATNKLAAAQAECPSGKSCITYEKKYLNKISVGDYVKMTPTSTSYTPTQSLTGCSSNVTINPSQLNIWRIISVNDDGTADMVTEYVSNYVPFCHKTGYNNYINALNTIANQYQNTNYTIRARHIGSSSGQSSIVNIAAPTSQPSCRFNTSLSTTIAQEQEGCGDMGYLNDYNLVKSALGTSYAKCYNNKSNNCYYWLASRYYGYDATPGLTFYGRYVKMENGAVSAARLYYYDGAGYFKGESWKLGIRPIVTLKSGLTTTSGDGKSESTAWTFS